MKKIEAFLQKYWEVRIFTRSDIDNFFWYDTNKIIVALLKNNKIARLKDWLYYIYNYGEEYISIDSKFIIPYISDTKIMWYGSALEYYDLNEQFFNATVLLTKKNYTKRIINVWWYKYIYVKDLKDFWLKKYFNWIEYIYITNIERTILDCFSRPELCGWLNNIAKAFYEASNEWLINYSELMKYIEFYNNKQKLYKTLWFFIDIFNIKINDVIYKTLIEKSNKSNYVKLTTYSWKPIYNSKWKLIINEYDNFKSLIQY